MKITACAFPASSLREKLMSLRSGQVLPPRSPKEGGVGGQKQTGRPPAAGPLEPRMAPVDVRMPIPAETQNPVCDKIFLHYGTSANSLNNDETR